MGIVYEAELRPSKMELLAAWLPQQPWFAEGSTALERLGSFRFDDPAGEVGIETLLVGAGEAVYQVPLTYRAAPLAGAAAHLVGTLEHSVLGRRWVYDAPADPVYAAELAAALLTGKPQAVQYTEANGVREILPETAQLESSGTATSVPQLSIAPAHSSDGGSTVLAFGSLTLRLRRQLALTPEEASTGPQLRVRWSGQDAPVLLATR